MSQLNIDEISREHFARIHRAALVLTGNPWDADDLAQETFLVLARQRNGYQGRSSIFTWLYGILLNLDRRERRRHGMRRKKLQVLWDNEPTQEKSCPAAETAIEVAEWKNSLWAWVHQLPDGQRQALVLKFSENLAYEDIARAMDCPVGTVKSRVYYGLIALRRLLAERGDEARFTPDHPYEDLTRAV